MEVASQLCVVMFVAVIFSPAGKLSLFYNFGEVRICRGFFLFHNSLYEKLSFVLVRSCNCEQNLIGVRRRLDGIHGMGARGFWKLSKVVRANERAL